MSNSDIDEVNNGEREEELHSLLHGAVDFEGLIKEVHHNPRLKVFDYVESILGKKISGDVIDIGAGTGYAGCWLAANRSNVKVIALECTKEAIYKNIPYCAEAFNVKEQVTPALGSFHDLSNYKERFDYAICFGSLHHSSDLYGVIKNIFHALKPEGYLIIQEPYAPDMTSNKCYRQIYDMQENFAGQIIRHGDRNDHFYRKCEYMTALHYCGFEMVHECDAAPILLERGFSTYLQTRLKNLISKLVNMKKEQDFSQYRKELLKPTKWLAVCKKEPKNSYVPHVWRDLL